MFTMIIKNATVFTKNNCFEDQDIYIKNNRICSQADISTEIIDAKDCYALPGLIDIHFHGCEGYDFCDASQEALEAITSYQLKNGITAICPATMTLSKNILVDVCDAATNFNHMQSNCSNHQGADLVGIHLEGPFLSYEKRGAQNPDFLSIPTYDLIEELQAHAEGLIKQIDIAPELLGALDFIKEHHNDFTISLAHTTANYDISKSAFDAGATHVTHLYNAMPAFSHRSPGLIGAAAENENVAVELICDGVHIHPSAVRATFSLFGDDRIILISDSMMATGLDDGNYSLGGQPVTVTGNVATLENGTIAGSATNLLQCLRIAVTEMNIPLESAIKCATINPAKSIGIDRDYGSIEIGKLANIILLDKTTLQLKSIIKNGKLIDTEVHK